MEKEVKMRRKGQAAMEFLMTYGWAILAAIVVIGVLAIYLNPNRITPSATFINPPFNAKNWNVDNSDGAVNLEIANNGAEDVDISAIGIAVDEGATSCTTLNPTTTLLGAGNSAVYSVLCPGMAASGSTFRGDITITFAESGSALSSSRSGQIVDTIIA